MNGKKAKAREFFDKFFLRALMEFVALAAVISLLGTYVYDKMDILLIDSLKEAVAQQSQSTAYVLGERFQHKLDELESRAELVQQGEISPEAAVAIATIGTKDGRNRGILRQDNTALAGTPLPSSAFAAIGRVWLEQQVIEYRQGIGLIFAIPFDLAGEMCIFYEVFDDEAVQSFYKMMSYNGKGTLVLGSDFNDWVLLSGGLYPEVTEGKMPNFNEAWQKIQRSEILPQSTNSSYAEDEEYAFFFHSTYISPKDHLLLAGYAEWDDVVVGIDYIYTLMKMVFYVVLILLFVLVGYHMRTQQLKHSEHQSALAESANRAKSDFLSRMSHEIRTPINAVMGMDEMILREAKDPAILEYAQNLQSAARTLLELINDILDFSKIEAGKMEIIPAEYQLGSLLNDLVNMIQKRAENKGLTFQVEADPKLPTTLFGDEVRIKQVVTNLLTNAVKYTEKGGARLKVGFHPIDGKLISLEVSVSDTGIGIKQEDMEKLFCSFERIEEKRNRNIEGTGLGMNIAHQLLAMMGGELKVESVYGQGSTFSFQIVQKVINPAPLGDFEEAYHQSLSCHKDYQVSFRAPEAKILVVDDTVMNLTVVKGLLKQTKIQIDTAQSGQECLGLVQKEKYDIIFLDHMMPGMDGIETLYAMKCLEVNLNQATPVISLTANAIRGARDQYLAAGFQDYLTKPINCTKLEEMILKYLPPGKAAEITPEEGAQEAVAEEALPLPSWLTETQGLDTAAGIGHCGSNAAYLDVLTVFAGSIQRTAKEIEEYFQQEEWKSYTTKVHALKSTAKIIGAAELSERARRLEDAGNAGYIDEIRQDHRPLMELYLTYAEKLAPLMPKEEDTSEKPPIDPGELAEAFEAMSEIAATFDYDSLQFIFESLDGYHLPEKEAGLYKEIKAAAAVPDWDKVKELLEQAKEA
ncbi:ATP-binding protein [Selenomonas sp. AB3002]|uniref:ATP-binding protein n=1 Tax=Selenomonas sp. AB3002 TaxID=1392502 RepID=UPI0006919898